MLSAFQSNILPSASNGICPFLTTIDASSLRTTCKEAFQEVAAYPWHDPLQRIHGPLASWHRAFPLATAANLRYRLDIKDKDCHFYLNKGLTTLVLTGCKQKGLTFEAFKNLKELMKLDLRGCDDDRVLPEGFGRYLPKLRDVYITDHDDEDDHESRSLSAEEEEEEEEARDEGMAQQPPPSSAIHHQEEEQQAVKRDGDEKEDDDEAGKKKDDDSIPSSYRDPDFHHDKPCTTCGRYSAGKKRPPHARRLYNNLPSNGREEEEQEDDGYDLDGVISYCIRQNRGMACCVLDNDYKYRGYREERLCEACTARRGCSRCKEWDCRACQAFDAEDGDIGLDFDTSAIALKLRRCIQCREKVCCNCSETCRVCKKTWCRGCVGKVGYECARCEDYSMENPELMMRPPYVCEACYLGRCREKCPVCKRQPKKKMAT